jgi:hypothetical protein
MNVSIYTLRGWAHQPSAVLRPGATSNIFYVTLSAGSLEQVPEGMGPLRVSLDGVECLAVSPVGPNSEHHGLEFLLVMPTVMPAALGA